MNSITPDITIFKKLTDAWKAFENIKSADLLYAKSEKRYYVDRIKKALKEWPGLFEVIKTK